jgi:hypothetical protein
MGVQQAQPAQAGRAQARARQLGDVDGLGVAQKDHFRLALAVDQKADLAAGVRGQLGQLAGLLGGIAARFGKAALVEPGETLDLAGLEALGVAAGFLGDGDAS